MGESLEDVAGSSARTADGPPFLLGKSRYDQQTFVGRLRHFMDVIDPRTLLTSQKKLDESIALLDAYKEECLPAGVSNEDLWQAQKIKQAIIHPDTGEKILMPFRMSGYVPFGSPIVTGLLLPNPTMAQTAFWQWLNQSHNACVNYANRNATKETTTRMFLEGYAAAVGSALTIALGLSVAIKKAERFSPATRVLVQKFVPFPAVSCASVFNVLLMRKEEVQKGIDVVNKDGNVVGTSKVAARQALKEMAITRAVLPAPILIIPPIVMTVLERTWLLKKYGRLHLPLNATVCTLSFAFALPVAIAIFPRMSKIAVENLENEIKSATDEKFLFYNKGL